MKKFRFTVLCALLSTSCCFVACDDSKSDDDPECSIENACTDTNKYCSDEGACVDKKADDADCANANECKSGKCESNKCVAAESGDAKKDNGAACKSADECKSGKCEDDKCVANESGDEKECSAEKACTDTNKYCSAEGACVDKKDNDADCANANECKSGKCDSNKCVADASGEVEEKECSDTKACTDTNKYCSAEGACVDKKVDGSTCSSANECKSGKCEQGNCLPAVVEPECSATKACTDTNKFCSDEGTCEDKKNDDATCSSDKECKSNYCEGDASSSEEFEGVCKTKSEENDKKKVSDYKGQECASIGEIFCVEDGVVVCKEFGTSAVYDATVCSKSQVCAVSGSTGGCFDICDKENATKTICDTNAVNEGADYFGVIKLTCTKEGSVTYWKPTGTDRCGQGCYAGDENPNC